jgi:hypothetical protein
MAPIASEAKNKSKKTAEMFASAAVLTLIYAWIVMVALGILHRPIPGVPLLGYWETYVVVLAIKYVKS